MLSYWAYILIGNNDTGKTSFQKHLVSDLCNPGAKSVCRIGIRGRIYMHILVGILYLLGSAIVSSTLARADQCVNSRYTPHHKGEHNFATSSAVENDGQIPTQHWTCVRNLNKNPNHDVKITWYIPGPHVTWIPGGEQVDTPRRPLDDKQMSIKGCLKYGNLREFTRAEFVGSEEEAGRAKKEEGEEGTECGIMRKFQERPASRIVRKVPAKDWLDSFRIFFPTDLGNVSNTMLRLDANVSVHFSDESVQTTLTYSAEKLEGRPSGNLSQVRYVLRFPAAEQSLADIVFSQVSAEPQQLAPSGRMEFEVPHSRRFRMAPLTVLFFDKEKRLSGAFEASILSPVR